MEVTYCSTKYFFATETINTGNRNSGAIDNVTFHRQHLWLWINFVCPFEHCWTQFRRLHHTEYAFSWDEFSPIISIWKSPWCEIMYRFFSIFCEIKPTSLHNQSNLRWITVLLTKICSTTMLSYKAKLRPRHDPHKSEQAFRSKPAASWVKIKVFYMQLSMHR